MQYVLYIEYKASEDASYEYKMLNAKSLEDAIIEADEIYNPETMYLIRVMQRQGGAYRPFNRGKDIRAFRYRAIECKRTADNVWHANDDEHNEMYHVVEWHQSKIKGGWSRGCAVELRIVVCMTRSNTTKGGPIMLYEIAYDYTDDSGYESRNSIDHFDGSWHDLQKYIREMRKDGCYNIVATCIREHPIDVPDADATPKE